MSEVESAPLWAGKSYPFAITFYPGLARALEKAGCKSATTKAIILSRIHDILSTSPFIRGDGPWVGNSHEHWRADHFPFLSVEGVKKLLNSLEKEDKLLLAHRTGRTNPVKYRPDYAKIAELQANEPEKLVANEQIKVTFGGQKPPTSASIEVPINSTFQQNAPDAEIQAEIISTTSTNTTTGQDGTEAHVEERPSALSLIDPDEFSEENMPWTLTPLIGWDKLHRILSQHRGQELPRLKQGESLDEMYLYWMFGGEIIARCTQAEFDEANQQQPSGKLTARLGERQVTLPRITLTGGH